MSDNNETNKELEILNDILTDDILVSSDEEVMEIASSIYETPVEEITRVRDVMLTTVLSYRKERLKNAKKSFEKQRTVTNVVKLSIKSLDEKRKIIKTLSNNDNLTKKVTMAARKEGDLTENDLDIFLNQALKLGIIDKEGNVLCDD